MSGSSRACTRTNDLTVSASLRTRHERPAFTAGVSGAKQLDDVLKTLALRVSDLSVTLALQPVASGLAGSFNQLFTGFGTSNASNTAGGSANLAAAMGAIKPFAAGGVIGTPTYFRSRRAASGSPVKPARKRSCRSRAGPTAGSALPPRAPAVRTSRSRSRRRTRQASAARNPISPARSPAPSRAGNAASSGIHDRSLPRGAVPARHRAQERRRAGAQDRDRRARLRPRGTQRALGAFAPALRRGLRRQDVRDACPRWSRSSRSGAGGSTASAGATGSINSSAAPGAPSRRSTRRSAPATARTATFQLVKTYGSTSRPIARRSRSRSPAACASRSPAPR